MPAATAQHRHEHHGQHEMPTSGGALTRVALSATLHCLTGCAIGEVLGMVVGTALGFSQWGTVALAVAIPGAMEAGVGSVLFWGSLSFALVIAGAVAVPVNRWLIARGKGHAAVHETGIHGGPSPRIVGIVAAVAFVFGSAVLIAQIAGGSSPEHGTTHGASAVQLDGGASR